MAHFFHRAIKAYSTGTRKRRKIHGDDFGDVRWHKTGRTKPVILDGIQKACKKIMVLYMSMVRGGKAEKTNWVMHQYHLGTEEDEKEGDYVISKIFYQQQQAKQADKVEQDILESTNAMIPKVDPVTPKSVTPDPPRPERHPDFELRQESPGTCIDPFNQVQFGLQLILKGSDIGAFMQIKCAAFNNDNNLLDKKLNKIKVAAYLLFTFIHVLCSKENLTIAFSLFFFILMKAT